MSANGSSEGIAIIGMACRFPGAKRIAAFWENLCRGIESITQARTGILAIFGKPANFPYNRRSSRPSDAAVGALL